jgi:hypothetical protein
MSVSFVKLSEANPRSVRELLIKRSDGSWSEEFADSYFAWRYGARESGETLLACHGTEYVGIIDSFVRPYRMGEDRVAVRETCDWFCLPKYRALGVGLHLMRRMMAEQEPILSIGGTEYTRDLLPRLKWARLPDLDGFVLPVSARTMAGLLAHQLWPRQVSLVYGIPDVRLVRRLRRQPPPSANVSVRPRSVGDVEDIAGVAPYALTPILEPSTLEWLAWAPAALGEFVVLYFFCDGEPVGISLSRLEKLRFGCKAQMVHLHGARFEVIEWIVSETVHHLVDRGAGAILCYASCPTTTAALSALGFVRRSSIPVYWWPADKPPPSGVLHLTSLRADDALQLSWLPEAA